MTDVLPPESGGPNSGVFDGDAPVPVVSPQTHHSPDFPGSPVRPSIEPPFPTALPVSLVRPAFLAAQAGPVNRTFVGKVLEVRVDNKFVLIKVAGGIPMKFPLPPKDAKGWIRAAKTVMRGD